ncbi:MAG: glycosyltransferase family 4 protein [Candidatus Bathyarchaeia archaeon]
MAKTKLCIVTHTFLPHVGGIERVAYEQGKRLMRKNLDVTVLTSRMTQAKRYTYEGIPVRCYDSLSLGFRLGIPYPIPSISSYKPFLEAVKASRLIHAHGHPYLSSLLAAKLARRYRTPFVLTQHNTFIDYNGVWDKVERLNDLAVGTQVLKAAQRIITVSNATRNYVLSLGADADKVTVLHNGVDVDRFKPDPKMREETRRKLGIRPDEIVVLTVRRLVYKNGIDTFIDAAKAAVQKNPKAVFLSVGTGPDLSQVKTRIEQLQLGGNLRLAGFVSDAELPSYYNAADLFVLPSKSGEGLPLVGLEAMSCGLPVVATDVGGISEVLTPSCGKLVPPDSPETMAEAVLDLALKETVSLKEKVRANAVEMFGWDRNVERLAKLYEEFI